MVAIARRKLRSQLESLAQLVDPVAAAKAASLRYVSDEQPGIRRIAVRGTFDYVDPGGNKVRDPDTLERIRSLVIPPAWTDVWICPIANGHLQVTGRDARRRKQYRYHPRWRQIRDDTKYGRLVLFGATLPRIRERVDHDLSLPGIPREKVLATIVRLLEATLIRVGNEEYARTNDSFGLTTLRNDHVQVNGTTILFRFRGKSGIVHQVGLRNRRLANMVRRCQELPGYQLFEYLDDQGQPHAIGSADVNDYLREISGEEFTAKDFRTWAGTVLAAAILSQAAVPRSPTAARRTIADAIRQVARRLGNTAAVCRKCYVHPAIIDAFLEGSLTGLLSAPPDPTQVVIGPALTAEEKAVLRLLQNRLAAA